MMAIALHGSQGIPAFHHKGWLKLLRAGDRCGECARELCPMPTECLAGAVLDECDCCPECGNVEGQICDLDIANPFYGKCGEHLECRLHVDDNESDVPEPQCACIPQGTVCGSDGKTYGNVCRFNEMYAKKNNLTVRHDGPCETAPVISLPPRDVHNFTGNDIIFGCEVSAYPMPLLEWKKKGNQLSLPGDDAHISVQARGGPQKYGITGWLQIQGIKKSDEGIYICHTTNKYGTALAAAKLEVTGDSSSTSFQMKASNRITSHNTDYREYYDQTEEDGGDEEYESGDYES